MSETINFPGQHPADVRPAVVSVFSCVNKRENPSESTTKGTVCKFKPRKIRHIRVTQTSNSANTGRHLVEVMTFKK